MNKLTSIGEETLKNIQLFFPEEKFTAAMLNNKISKKVTGATLNSLVKRNYLIIFNTKPVSYLLKNSNNNNNDIDNKERTSKENFDNNNNNKISLYNKDCLEQLKFLSDNFIDCIITDPPYFIDGMGNNWQLDTLNNKVNKGKVVQSMPVGMKFDPKQGIELQNFMEKVSKEIYRILKPGGFYLAFSQARLYHRLGIAIENCGFEIRDMAVWKREGQAKAFSQDHFVRKRNISEEEKEKIITELGGRKTPQLKPQIEPIVIAQKPKEGTYIDNWLKYKIGLIDTTISLDGMFPGNVMEVPKDKNKIPHLTVKPVKLMEHLIKIFSPENAIICDPFMGSGTTGIACLHTNRQFIGIELNEEYFNLAKERIQSEQN